MQAIAARRISSTNQFRMRLRERDSILTSFKKAV